MSKRAREEDIEPVAVVNDARTHWDFLVPDVHRIILALLPLSAKFAWSATNRENWEAREKGVDWDDIMEDVVKQGHFTLFDHIVYEWLPHLLTAKRTLMNLLAMALNIGQAEIIARFMVGRNLIGNEPPSLTLGHMSQPNPLPDEGWCNALGKYGSVDTIYKFSPFLIHPDRRTTLVRSLAKHDHADALQELGYVTKHAARRLWDDSRLVQHDTRLPIIPYRSLIKWGSIKTIGLTIESTGKKEDWTTLLGDVDAMTTLLLRSRETIVSTLRCLSFHHGVALSVPQLADAALRVAHYPLYSYLETTFHFNGKSIWTTENQVKFIKYAAKFPAGIPHTFVKEVMEAIGSFDVFSPVLRKVIRHGTSEVMAHFIFDCVQRQIHDFDSTLLGGLLSTDIQNASGLFFSWVMAQSDRPPALRSCDWKNILLWVHDEPYLTNVWIHSLKGLQLGIIPPLTSFYFQCMQFTPVGEWEQHFQTLFTLGCPLDMEHDRCFGIYKPYHRLLAFAKIPGTALYNACLWLMKHGAQPPCDEEIIPFFLAWPVAHLDQVVALVSEKRTYFYTALWESLFSGQTKTEDRAKRMAAIRGFYPNSIETWRLNEILKRMHVYSLWATIPILKLLDNLKVAGIALSSSIWCKFIKKASADPTALMIAHMDDTFVDKALLKAALTRATSEARDRDRAPFQYLRGKYPHLITRELKEWAFDQAYCV